MSSSTVFSLEGQGLRLESAADIEPHLRPLQENSAVEEIRLGGNTFGVAACEALAKALESKKSLQVANLADIFTSRLTSEIPPALSALLTALLHLPLLHTVDLSDNAFGLSTQAPLVDFLSRHVPLRHLILNNNGLGPRAGALIGDALTALHAKKEAARKEPGGVDVPALETVICGRNRLENGSMEAWAKAFAAHQGVQVVKMVQNGIRQEGISLLLMDGLRHARHLRVLDLQDNTITAVGSRALADAVVAWTNLQELGVGDCLLSARGSVLLADALAKGVHSKLEALRLQYNEMDVHGLKGFAHAAKNALPALKRIEVNGNVFNEDDPSVEALRELLDERRHDAGIESDDDLAGQWGLDELSDLDDESDDEDEEDEEDEKDEKDDEEKEDDKDVPKEREEEDKLERVLEEADQAENQNVALEADPSIDELAEKLSKTNIHLKS
ncbi:MAG: hypothetical protein M1826_005320 [Phylliscum demangeonii]|nr:MAG: hypothetical protein M1826_005320 [Phylliscum demangeonii]